MPIPAITGRLRRKMWLDGTVTFGLALSAGYAYWYSSHLAGLERQEAYYVKLEKERRATGQPL